MSLEEDNYYKNSVLDFLILLQIMSFRSDSVQVNNKKIFLLLECTLLYSFCAHYGGLSIYMISYLALQCERTRNLKRVNLTRLAVCFRLITFYEIKMIVGEK